MQYGVRGVAAAVLVATTALAIVFLTISNRVLEIDWRTILANLRPSLVAAATMSLLVIALRQLLMVTDLDHPSVLLILSVLLGAAVYVLWLLRLEKPLVSDLRQILFAKSYRPPTPDAGGSASPTQRA